MGVMLPSGFFEPPEPYRVMAPAFFFFFFFFFFIFFPLTIVKSIADVSTYVYSPSSSASLLFGGFSWPASDSMELPSLSFSPSMFSGIASGYAAGPRLLSR